MDWQRVGQQDPYGGEDRQPVQDPCVTIPSTVSVYLVENLNPN